MQKRSTLLATVAVSAGLALGFFVTIGGIVAALGAIALWLKAARPAVKPDTLR